MGDLRGEMSSAAAYIKDVLAGLRGEERYQVAAEFPYKGVRGIVERGIPIGRHLPIVAGRRRPKRDRIVRQLWQFMLQTIDLSMRTSRNPDILVSWEG